MIFIIRLLFKQFKKCLVIKQLKTAASMFGENQMSEKVNEDLKTAVEVKPNVCIITFFMNNIDMKSVGLQRSVVEKYNKSKHPHYSIHTDMKNGASMDFAWALHGVPTTTFK